jgi:hypothetical protein
MPSTSRTRKLLPKLRKIDPSDKKYHYKLKSSARSRRMAINEGVQSEQKKTGYKKRQAATAKKARLNILRIYRRTRNVKECRKITRDMKYMDKKYGLGKTMDICGKNKE